MNERTPLLSIEPLTDVRRQRIKRAVFDQLEAVQTHPPRAVTFRPDGRTGHRRRVWLAGALGAAALILALLLLRRDDDAATTRPRAAALLPGSLDSSRIVTGEDDSTLDIGTAVLTAHAHSALVVSGDESQGLLVVLERGGVTCRVTPRPQGAPFRIRAGEVQVSVTGTEFTVERRGEGARVAVAQGSVEIRAGGQIRRISAGDEWTSVTPEPYSEPSAPPPLAELDPTPAQASAHPPRKRHTRKPSERASQPPAAAAPGVSDAPPSAKERFNEAAQMERTAPARSAALYRELVRDGGSWAKPALFALGRLQYERGAHDEARKLLNRYVQRYPSDANAQMARTLLDRLR